jgi:hydroxymethylbilane synthase
MDNNNNMNNNMNNNSTNTTPVIGTRGSALALWQARKVASLLDVKTELTIIKTSGDRFQDIPLQGQSQTGFFTKEIENQLLEGVIDIAVHSLKDLPTAPHPDLVLEAYLPRAAANDLLLIHPDWHDPEALIPVKSGCKVGATSLRRQALLRLYGPQAEPTMLRGNVPTRIDKCKSEQYGAIVLAQAGVERLEIDTEPLIIYKLNPAIWLPAPGQGVVAVQARRGDSRLLEHIAKLDHRVSRDAVTIERQLLAHFEGGCHTAFGAYALPEGGQWNVTIGLDQEEGRGWGQTLLREKSLGYLTSVTPTDIEAFSPLPVENKENLCIRTRL